MLMSEDGESTLITILANNKQSWEYPFIWAVLNSQARVEHIRVEAGTVPPLRAHIEVTSTPSSI